METSTLNAGRLERVYFYRGTFTNGGRRFIKAPFDFLKLDGESFIVPTSSFADGVDGGLSGLWGNDKGDEFDVAQSFFYDTLENIVMEEYEMGDWAGAKDNWMQVHKFGLV